MKCKSRECTNKPENGLTFCESCLSGMLEHELSIDDLVPGLENAVEPTWERIKEVKKMTPLYDRIIKHSEEKDNLERLELSHKVWDPTPFVIDVYVGDINEFHQRADESEIRIYCGKNFGKESWPIHNKPADWHRGGATVNGWTWFGFRTKEMMEKFIKDWPKNVKTQEVKCD